MFLSRELPDRSRRTLVMLTGARQTGKTTRARASGRAGRSDARAMRDVARAIGEKWLGGIVAYRGDRIEKLADPGIWAVPSRRLFT